MEHYYGIVSRLFLINKKTFILMLLLIILLSNDALSQSDSLHLYDLTLVQLSKLKITSASKVSQNISEVPSTVFVITGEQIKENGYFTLEEALSDLPGFQFRNILGINSYVFQRGVPNQNNLTLLLIDGVQVNELNSGGFYAGGQYNLSNVERIEVVYGPSSVAYGTNAMAGIINIITKSPNENRVEINTLAGSFNTFKNDFSYSLFNDKKAVGILASGMVKKTDKANLKGAEGDNNWTDLMDNFENDYSFDFKIQIKNLLIGSNLLYKQSSTATWEKSVGTLYRDYGTSWNILFLNNYLKYSKKVSPKATLSSILYNRNTTVLNNTVYYVVDTAQIGYYRPNNLTGFENILNYDINTFFTITGGLTLELERLAEKNTFSFSDSPEKKPPKPLKPIMVTNSLASVFIEPRVLILKSFYLSGGVRFDQSSVYSHVLTPRAGLIYHFRKHLFRFSYSEAFRAPKPWDYTDGLGNASLLPEKMKSLEIALSFTLSDNYKVDLTGYENRLENAINKEFSNEGYKWVNNAEVNTDGIEISIRHTSQKLKSSINYTLNKSYDQHGESVPEISMHTGNASVTYSFNDHIRMNLRANYIGRRENPKVIVATNSRYIDPCLVFNGALSLVDVRNFAIQLSVKNIFNTKYYHTSNRDPDRYRQPQRTLMLSVSYGLNN
jgi:outer membrane receptor for ferrienterochelin and colicins